MVVSISVSAPNIDAIVKDLDDLAKKQVPFATALALTRTAIEAREHLRGGLSDYFTTRSTWVARSIQADRAEKKDLNPTARVGSLYAPMALHAVGGSKTSESGDVGVPVAARANKSQRTRPAQFPARLAAKRGFFIAPFSRAPFRVGQGPNVGVFERVGEKRRGGLKLWWVLKQEVAIKQDWPFERDAVRVVEAALLDNFVAALEFARRTAK